MKVSTLKIIFIIGFIFSCLIASAQIKTIPVTGTTLANPLSGLIEFRQTGKNTIWVDTVDGTVYSGLGNIKDLANATNYSRIKFNRGTKYEITPTINDGTNIAYLQLKYTGNELVFSNGTYKSYFDQTGTTMFFQSLYPSFAGVTYEPTTGGYVLANHGALSILHRAANDLRYLPLGNTITVNGTTYSLSANPSFTVASGTTQTITLTADATGTGTASIAVTLATVNSNVGSFGSASTTNSITVNAKGLTTAVSTVAIQIPESQVTNLTTDLLNKDNALIPTIVKTAMYTLTVSDFVPIDCSSGNLTFVLPTTPADRTVAGLKLIATSGTFSATINAGGSDVFNKGGGSTSLTLSLLNQAVLLQYKASSGIWYVLADDLPLGQLDARYVAGSAATFTINGTGMALGTSSTVTAAAGTLTGTTLNSTVVNSSLTSAGTFTTGTWQAGVIAGQYGGTGVANTGKTITLGGSFITTGTSTPTWAFGTTNRTYTFPDVATTVVGRTGNMAANRIAVMNDANQISTLSGIQAKNFDVGNKGWAYYAGDSSTNNFVLANYNLATNTTILNCPTANGAINLRFQNGGNIFSVVNQAGQPTTYAYMNGNFMVGNSTTPTAKLSVSGNVNNGYLTTGVGLSLQTFTLTNPGVSSTTALSVIHSVARPSLASANTQTLTTNVNFQIDGAAIVTNSVTTTNNVAFRVAQDISDFEGKVGIGTVAPTYSLDVAGDLGIPTLGKGVRIAVGTGGLMGTIALSAGTVTVSVSGITSSDIATGDYVSASGTGLGVLQYACTANVLTITSLVPTTLATQVLDNSTVSYVINKHY